MRLEQLGQVKTVSVSKEPEEVWNAPAAVYALTSKDIRPFGEDSSVRDIESVDP